jgi:hypothetical protein
MNSPVTRMRQAPAPMAAPASAPSQQGQWTWDGSNWICNPCFDGGCGPFFPSPPNQPPWYPGANGGVSFGQVAPPNPIRGHFWWDGVTLWLFDGATWVGIGPGAVPVNTTEPSLAISNISAGTVPVSTWTIAPITGTPTINVNGTWNPAAHTWTPTRPGIYSIEAQVWAPIAATDLYQIAILKNDSGGPYPNLQNVEIVTVQSAHQVGWISNSGLVQMNGTTDFIRMWVQTTQGTFDQGYGFPVLRAWLAP